MADIDDLAEEAFWRFDEERKRTGAERDAFKRQLRKVAAGGTPTDVRIAQAVLRLRDALALIRDEATCVTAARHVAREALARLEVAPADLVVAVAARPLACPTCCRPY